MGWMKIFPQKPFSSMFEKFGINTGIIFCNFDFEPVMYVIIIIIFVISVHNWYLLSSYFDILLNR